MLSISISRPSNEIFASLVAWIVVVDGKKVGKLLPGGEIHLNINEGTHKLYVRNWSSSLRSSMFHTDNVEDSPLRLSVHLVNFPLKFLLIGPLHALVIEKYNDQVDIQEVNQLTSTLIRNGYYSYFAAMLLSIYGVVIISNSVIWSIRMIAGFGLILIAGVVASRRYWVNKRKSRRTRS